MYTRNGSHKSILTCDICHNHELWLTDDEARNEHEARVVAISSHGWYCGHLGGKTKDVCAQCWSGLDAISLSKD